MNTRNSLVSVLMLVCVLLSACTSAVPATQVPTSLPPTAAPTIIPPTQAPVAIESAVNLNQVADISNSAETVSVDFLNNRIPLSAFDSIWFLSDTQGRVTRWDPETRQILATIEVGDPGKAPYGVPVVAIATDDALWVASVAAHEIVKIDPETNQIVKHIAIPYSGDNFYTSNMVLAGNTAWVWDYDKKLVQGVSLDTGQVVASVGNVKSIGGFEGSFWYSNSEGTVQLDPVSNQVIKQLPSTHPIPAFSADGSMWGFSKAVIFRMDPQTGEFTARIRFGTEIDDVKFAGGSLWVTVSPGAPPACHNGSYLIQIDPKTNAATGKIALDCPFDIIPYQNGLYATAADESHLELIYVEP